MIRDKKTLMNMPAQATKRFFYDAITYLLEEKKFTSGHAETTRVANEILNRYTVQEIFVMAENSHELGQAAAAMKNLPE